MPTNPYDDIIRNLARAMEELINTISEDDVPRFVGCTIITGQGDDPRIVRFEEEEEDEIRYEAIEGPESIFITAEIPPGAQGSPFADIHPNFIRICVDEKEVRVDLPCAVDVTKSTYTVRHGVMDIVCHKMLAVNR